MIDSDYRADRQWPSSLEEKGTPTCSKSTGYKRVKEREIQNREERPDMCQHCQTMQKDFFSPLPFPSPLPYDTANGQDLHVYVCKLYKTSLSFLAV